VQWQQTKAVCPPDSPCNQPAKEESETTGRPGTGASTEPRSSASGNKTINKRPVKDIKGVGNTFKKRLGAANIKTIGQLKKLNIEQLMEILNTSKKQAQKVLAAGLEGKLDKRVAD
jgi:hypothetical protein